MGRRLVGGWAALVYAFLYLPILIVVIYAFNGGRQVLNWEGFSTKWFGEALSDPTITEPLKNSLVIGVGNAAIACILGTALALALPRMRPFARVPFDGLVYMTLVTPEIVFGISALIFFVQAGIPLGLETILIAHVVFNTSVVALIVRARVVGMGEAFEEASYDWAPGRSARSARSRCRGWPRRSSRAACSRSRSPSTTSSRRSSSRERGPRRYRCGSSPRSASGYRRS